MKIKHKLEKYPYYMAPFVAAYKDADPSSEEAQYLRRVIAANIGDRLAVRLIIGIDPPEFAAFYPDMEKAAPSTMETIDSFLDKFGADHPVGGYMAGFPEEYDINKDSDAEIPVENSVEEINEKESGETIPENNITLKDFAFLVKNHSYKEALKIIELQNLNNPEKNVYFADQMRFLKKLIIIESYKSKSKG